MPQSDTDDDDLPLDQAWPPSLKKRRVLDEMIEERRRMQWLWRVSRVGVALLAAVATAVLWLIDHVKVVK